MLINKYDFDGLVAGLPLTGARAADRVEPHLASLTTLVEQGIAPSSAFALLAKNVLENSFSPEAEQPKTIAHILFNELTSENRHHRAAALNIAEEAAQIMPDIVPEIANRLTATYSTLPDYLRDGVKSDISHGTKFTTNAVARSLLARLS
jgi:hypothetical protein